MSSLSYPLSRLTELTREQGLKQALTRACKRAAADVSLYSREMRWSLLGRRLPSERTILNKTVSRWPNLDALVNHLCHKGLTAFVFSGEDRATWIAEWQKIYPSQAKLTLAQAENICNHRFDLLGTQYDFGDNGHSPREIDWHLDVTSGRRWPIDYVERIDRWMWSDRIIGDYKPIWELNRHQYFVTLGRAYWLTGEEKYAEACATQMLSWIRNNPCPFGINWYSALEIGIRLIAWSLAFFYLRSSQRFIELAGKAFVQSLYQQTCFLREHLTLDWMGRNNHVIGESAALATIGALFDEFAEAGEWRETGLRIVEEEVTRQTYPDGVNREQAPAYHRFVLDFVLLLLVLARRGALRPSPCLEAQGVAMLNYMMLAMTPAGDLPALGDGDDGRGFVLGTGTVQESCRETLAIGAVLLQRADFKFMAGDFGEEAFWLLGREGLAAFETIKAEQPKQISASFPHGGQYILRDDWTPRSDYAMFRCGEFGLAGEGFCAHAHCDLLSPVLWIKGQPLLVDSGTYTYHGPCRDQFRLTQAHNTVVVDSKEQALPSGPFSWQWVPTARCEAWEGQRVSGSLTTHDGVKFRRELVHPRPGVWSLNDVFIGTGYHQLQWTFQLAPGLLPVMSPQARVLRIFSNTEPGWCVIFRAPDVDIAIEDGWVSSKYGSKKPNKVIHGTWQGELQAVGSCFTWQFDLAGSEQSQRLASYEGIRR